MFPKLEIFVIIMCILCCCITFKCVKGFYGFYWNNKTDEMAINWLEKRNIEHKLGLARAIDTLSHISYSVGYTIVFFLHKPLYFDL